MMWPESCDPVNVWSLNGNSSKMAEVATFKFGTHAPRKTPDMILKKIAKRSGSGSCEP